MDRIQLLLHHPLFLSSLQKISDDERDRIYCCHGIEHLLDVARMAYIMVLEQKLDIDRELIYAAALLHDIGRWRQYEEDFPHDIASAQIAMSVMTDCGFNKQECMSVRDAITRHRVKSSGTESDLAEILYQADKKSRLCFMCKASDTCYWSKERKNMILYR